MATEYTIGIGTVGAGLWVSYNSGQKWRHIQRIHPEGNVRALAVSPHRPGEILGSLDEVGLIVSPDNGGTWERVGGDIDGEIWSIGYDPSDDQRVFVGARPGLLRSVDGCQSFQQLDTSINDKCAIGTPRITNVVFDPANPSDVWSSVEVGSLHRSCDGGDTWTALDPLGPSEFYGDVHGLTLRATDSGTELLATSPFGLGRSNDEGANWSWHEFDTFPGAKFEFAYCRCVQVPPWGDGTVIVCSGDYIPGAVGALEISRDGGESWKRAELPATPNSTMYWLATHQDLPGVVVATSVFGQIFVSDDYAESWRKLDRELGEIRAISLTPA